MKIKILQSKILLTVLFVCVLVLGFAGIGTTTVYAAKSGYSGNLTYTLDDNGVLTISGTGAMQDFSLYASWGYEGIKSVVIEDGVTSIGKNAFFRCTDLTEVTIPDSVTSIGENAFYNCSSLTSITIPDSVASIGSYAFYGCTALTEVAIPDSVTNLGNNAFENCSGLTTVIFEGNAPTLGTGVFNSVASESPFKIMVPADATGYTGRWTNLTIIKYYTVTYDLNGHGASDSQIAPENTIATKPADPAAEHYTFGSWYADADCTEGNEFDFTSVITEYITLYAKWTDHIFDDTTGLCFCGAVWVNEAAFPNVNFRNWITANITGGDDGVLTNEELVAVTIIFVDNAGINDLTGIEYFTALKILYCRNNQLESLDVSDNAALVELYCDTNRLTSLKLGNKPRLKILSCLSNQLTNLDVSEYTTLQSLGCSYNRLTSLDVSNCSELKLLSCGNNQLTHIDLSDTTNLVTLYCENNRLTSLDLSNCQSVYTWDGRGQSASIDIDRDALSASLPTGVSAANVTAVSGATLNGDVLENITGDSITYTYATGKTGCDLSVTLSVTYAVDAEVSQVSVTLDGDIGVNFYWTLGDTVINDSTAYFLVTLPNGDAEKIMVSDAPKGTPIGSSTEYYKISGYVAAKEMAEDIVVELYAGGELIACANCSVRGYAERAFAYSDDAELIAMMKQMLNYGAASQVLFNHNTNDLANSILEDSDKTVAAVTENDVTAAAVSGSVSGITNIEFSCIWETKTTLRHYFTIASGSTEGYTFKVGETVVEPVLTADGMMYYVDIPDISATDLGTDYVFTITNGSETQTITASVHSYMSSVIKYSDDMDLKNAINAMYAYNQAAIAYFNN